MSNSFIVSAPTGASVPLIASGAYPGVCIAIYDIGEQYNEMYDNYSRKCVFQFEIPEETVVIDGEEKPRVISETYTASLGERSNLRKVLESWRGRQFTPDELKGFDLCNVLGAPCLINIVHNENSKTGRTFAKISTISRLPRGMNVETDTHKRMFSLSNPDALEELETLPEWIQTRIKDSKTYEELTKNTLHGETVDDGDLPF